MELPSLLVIKNKFLIKVDDQALHVISDVSSFGEAVGYLTIYYYVFMCYYV